MESFNTLSTSNDNLCNSLAEISRYSLVRWVSRFALKLLNASIATLTVAIGVFNSWVMLLINSFLISANLFCRSRFRYNNENDSAVNATKKMENKIGIAMRLKMKAFLF